MSMVRALHTAFLGMAGGQVLVWGGEERDESDPVVKAHPSMFTPPPPRPSLSSRLRKDRDE